jgi:hypothetical protein
MDIKEGITDEVKNLASQIYSDIAQPAVKEIGSVLGRSVVAFLVLLGGFCGHGRK